MITGEELLKLCDADQGASIDVDPGMELRNAVRAYVAQEAAREAENSALKGALAVVMFCPNNCPCPACLSAIKAIHDRAAQPTETERAKAVEHKCSRTQCPSLRATCRHRQTGAMYCRPCAHAINKHNPMPDGLPLVEMPSPAPSQPEARK